MLAQKTMVDNILATYAKANPTNIEDGMTWYAEGRALIADIARECEESVETVTAVMAHLSPRVMWSRNVMACTHLCNGLSRPSGIMQRSWEMALDALNHEDPLSTLNGPKVKRFAKNFLGDVDVVTVDIWAVRAACGDRADEVNLKHKGVYEKIEKAYQVAAGKLGIAPAHLQAICWIVARNGRAS